MSNTPLTDSQLVRVYGKTGEVCGASPSCRHPTFVPAEFSRQQEREINALRKVVQAYETLRSEAEEWECDGLGLFAQHGWWESVDEAIDLLNSEYRPCTCHPDDSPPNPCPQKFALSECVTAAVHDNKANVMKPHPMLEPTHICKDCGAAWRQCDDFTFNLRGEKACPACDNAPVGGQLVSIASPLIHEINTLRARLADGRSASGPPPT